MSAVSGSVRVSQDRGVVQRGTYVVRGRQACATELLMVLVSMSRLMCDVDMAEEAELWRLEHGSSSPLSPGLRMASWPASPRSMEAVVGPQVTETMDDEPSRMPVASAVLAAARAGVTDATVLMPMMPAVALASSPPPLNSTVHAARRRVRGPTVTERRAEESGDSGRV